MVLFAEYCFNKSHSTAYGAVTYQTAFLKAHFPVAYMAALLTVNSDQAIKCKDIFQLLCNGYRESRQVLISQGSTLL